MATNEIPEKLINFKVYLEGKDTVGVADVEMPKLENMSESVSGAGIAGGIDSPTPGHYGPMSTSVKFRTITDDVSVLAAAGSHLLEFRGSQQIYDAGEYKTKAIRLVMKVRAKNVDLGSLQVGKPTDTANEFSVVYLKLYVGGKEKVEIDPLNFIAKINGVDQLASVRKDLGL